MDPLPPAPYVTPNPRIPKVLGILNIVFASALMLCGLCSIAYVLMIPLWAKAVDQIQKEVQSKEDAERKAAFTELDEAEKEAKTDEEKADIKARRKEVENRPKVSATLKMDLGTMGLTDPIFRFYIWTEFLSGLVLNLLLLGAGVGLVMRRMWGLKLGMWVAGLKLVRLVVVYGYCIVAIVPLMSLGMAKFQIQTVAQQHQAMGRPMPPGLSVDTMTKAMSIWFASCAVAVILIGSIYPIISLWLLSRPGARAACSRSGKTPETEESW